MQCFRKIRSFVRRSDRVTKRQSEALKNLWPIYGLDNIKYSFDPDVIFDKCQPIILEIGFGNGDSLCKQALCFPEKNFLGVEVHKPGLGSVLHKASCYDVKNLKVIDGDVVEIISQIGDDPFLYGVQIYFPDPWPKKKHHKRRLIQLPFIEDLAKCVCSNGFCHLVTDWDPYADWIDSVFSISDSWQKGIANPHQSEWLEKRSITRFEERGIKLGNKISEFLFTCVRSN